MPIKKIRVHITNSFHCTSTYVLAEYTNGEDYAYVSARQAKAARQRLCGSADCACGGPLGNRGTQPPGTGEILDLPSGEVCIVIPA